MHFACMYFVGYFEQRLENTAGYGEAFILMACASIILKSGRIVRFRGGALFNCSEGLKIGNRVFLGHDVSFYGADYDPDHLDMPARYAPIVIEDGAWIASRAMILKGVTMGHAPWLLMERL